MKKIILLSALILSLTGCTADQMSKAQTQVSTFDGSKVSQSKPMPTFGKDKWHTSGIFIGGRWSTNVPDQFVLDTFLIDSFENLTVLKLKIDGNIIDAKPLNISTELDRNEYYKSSKRQFIVPVEVVEKILNSQNTQFRMVTLSGKAFEGSIVLNGDKSMAYKSLSSVFEQVPK